MIVVTTKRAKQVGKTVIQASGNVTYTEKPDYSYYNYLSPAQQVDWERDYYNWWFSGGNGAVPDPISTFENGIAQEVLSIPWDMLPIEEKISQRVQPGEDG